MCWGLHGEGQAAGMLRSTPVVDGLLTVNFEDLRQVIREASTTCGAIHVMAVFHGTAFRFSQAQRDVSGRRQVRHVRKVTAKRGLPTAHPPLTGTLKDVTRASSPAAHSVVPASHLSGRPVLHPHSHSVPEGSFERNCSDLPPNVEHVEYGLKPRSLIPPESETTECGHLHPPTRGSEPGWVERPRHGSSPVGSVRRSTSVTGDIEIQNFKTLIRKSAEERPQVRKSF